MAVTLNTQTNRYIGLSGDAKPTGVPVGSVFWESDTNALYSTYDGTNWTLYTLY